MSIPQRTCIGCYQVKAKKDLIRIVKSNENGFISIDPQKRKNGRSAYVCPNIDCTRKAMQIERLNRAFRVTDCINTKTIELLKREILELITVNSDQS